MNIPGTICKRCGHKWYLRRPQLPKVCPKCKSPYWNKERKRKSDRWDYQDIKYLKSKLVDNLVKRRIIKTKRVENAFRKVDRHLFVHNETLENIYGDYSIVTKKIGVTPMSSSTSPSLMVTMLEMMVLDQDMKVLEIGTGTGYNAAILSEIVGPENVFSIDIDPDTVNEAKRNLLNAGYKNIKVGLKDGARGFPEYSPYDRIIITCSVDSILPAWINQLKDNGIIVAPLCFNGAQITVAFKKQGEILHSVSTGLGGFMKIRKKTFEETIKKIHPSKHNDLLIVTEHPKLFNEKKTMSLLRSQPNKKNRSRNNFKAKDLDNFLVFLALYENKSVDIYPEDNVTRKYGFKRGAGIIDIEKSSGSLITNNGKLIAYGKNKKAYNQLLKHLRKWNSMGCPTIDKLKIREYYKNNPPYLRKNEVLFSRPSVKLVVRTPIKK